MRKSRNGDVILVLNGGKEMADKARHSITPKTGYKEVFAKSKDRKKIIHTHKGVLYCYSCKEEGHTNTNMRCPVFRQLLKHWRVAARGRK